MNDALSLLDEELPEEPGPAWRCANCDAEFKTETSFNLHQRQKH